MTNRSLAHVTRRDVTTWPQYRVTKHKHSNRRHRRATPMLAYTKCPQKKMSGLHNIQTKITSKIFLGKQIIVLTFTVSNWQTLDNRSYCKTCNKHQAVFIRALASSPNIYYYCYLFQVFVNFNLCVYICLISQRNQDQVYGWYSDNAVSARVYLFYLFLSIWHPASTTSFTVFYKPAF